MSITAVSAVWSASFSEASVSAYAFSPDANITASSTNAIIILVAMNNIDTVDGQGSTAAKITDTKGNYWRKIGEYTNTVGGVAADGATISAWLAILSVDLLTSDTITISFTTLVTAKAVSALKFNATNPNNLRLVPSSLQTLSNDNSDAGSMSISGLTSKEYFFVRAIASETDTATVSSNTSSWSAGLALSSGTGGAKQGHMCLNSEYLVSTATGATSDPTMTDVTSDRASLLFAIEEFISTGWTVISHISVASANGNNAVSGNINTVGANLFIMVLACQTGTTPVVSDSMFNVWTPLTGHSTSSGSMSIIYYCINPLTNASHSFNVFGTSTFPAIAVIAFNGLIVTPQFDQENGTLTEAATSLATGSITPAVITTELIIAAMGLQANSSNYAIDSGMILLEFVLDGTGASYGVGLAYIVQNVTAAINPTWSWTPSSYCGVGVAAFKMVVSPLNVILGDPMIGSSVF